MSGATYLPAPIYDHDKAEFTGVVEEWVQPPPTFDCTKLLTPSNLKTLFMVNLLVEVYKKIPSNAPKTTTATEIFDKVKLTQHDQRGNVVYEKDELDDNGNPKPALTTASEILGKVTWFPRLLNFLLRCRTSDDYFAVEYRKKDGTPNWARHTRTKQRRYGRDDKGNEYDLWEDNLIQCKKEQHFMILQFYVMMDKKRSHLLEYVHIIPSSYLGFKPHLPRQYYELLEAHYQQVRQNKAESGTRTKKAVAYDRAAREEEATTTPPPPPPAKENTPVALQDPSSSTEEASSGHSTTTTNNNNNNNNNTENSDATEEYGGGKINGDSKDDHDLDDDDDDDDDDDGGFLADEEDAPPDLQARMVEGKIKGDSKGGSLPKVLGDEDHNGVVPGISSNGDNIFGASANSVVPPVASSEGVPSLDAPSASSTSLQQQLRTLEFGAWVDSEYYEPEMVGDWETAFLSDLAENGFSSSRSPSPIPAPAAHSGRDSFTEDFGGYPEPTRVSLTRETSLSPSGASTMGPTSIGSNLGVPPPPLSTDPLEAPITTAKKKKKDSDLDEDGEGKKAESEVEGSRTVTLPKDPSTDEILPVVPVVDPPTFEDQGTAGKEPLPPRSHPFSIDDLVPQEAPITTAEKKVVSPPTKVKGPSNLAEHVEGHGSSDNGPPPPPPPTPPAEWFESLPNHQAPSAPLPPPPTPPAPPAEWFEDTLPNDQAPSAPGGGDANLCTSGSTDPEPALVEETGATGGPVVLEGTSILDANHSVDPPSSTVQEDGDDEADGDHQSEASSGYLNNYSDMSDGSYSSDSSY